MKESYAKFKGWAPDKFLSLSDSDFAYFEKELHKIGIKSLRGMRVLEIGFGNGNFAKYALDDGAIYYGVDSDSELLERARKHGLNVSDAIPTNLPPLDLAVCIDVLEHMDAEELTDCLTGIRLALKSKSLVFVRIPSGDSPFSGYIFRNDITHKLLLGSRAFCQIARLCGLSVEFISAPAIPMSRLGVFTSIRRALNAALQIIALNFVRIFIYGGDRNVYLHPNMCVWLRKP